MSSDHIMMPVIRNATRITLLILSKWQKEMHELIRHIRLFDASSSSGIILLSIY